MYWQGDFDALRESIVRVHVRATRALPDSLAIPNVLRLARNGTTATAVVQDWRPELREELAQRLGAEVEVEPLALEEIFLELHR